MRFPIRTAAWLVAGLLAACSEPGGATTTTGPGTTAATTITTTPLPAPTTTTAATTSTTTTGPPTTTTSVPAATTTTSTVPPWWREVTADDPLRVWVIGDSLTPHVGRALRDLGGAGGLLRVSVEAWGGTGLARPDILDWPALVVTSPPPFSPDAVVVLLGANDGQGMASPRGWLAFGTPEWDARYAALAGGFMDQLLGSASRVYWVGLPIMGSPDYDSRMRHISAIVRQQAALRLEARFIEAYSLFQGEDGGFAVELPDAAGNPVPVRSTDGIHFTAAGGQRLALRIMEELAADWGPAAG